MSEDVARLAQALGVAIRPEHLEEVERAWRMMQPHRQRVRAAALTPGDEPAPVFRPQEPGA